MNILLEQQLDAELTDVDPVLAEIVRAIVLPSRDPDHELHVHKCGSLYSDDECPESPCCCACGAVLHWQPANGKISIASIMEFTAETSPIVWLLPDGRRHLYPDPREREDAGL